MNDSNPELPEHYKPMTELDFCGAALTPSTLQWGETMLRPLAQVVTHVDVILRRVSLQHLNEARKDANKQMAERYHEKARLVVRDADGKVTFRSAWFTAWDNDVRLEYVDDTTTATDD